MSSELGARKVFFREAIARAVHEAMSADPRVILLGQDVGAFGGAYKEFQGLYEAFGPARVRDTPVAEAAMVGIGAGAAAAGYRPLVSITYMDFLVLGLDALVNYAAKARFKTAGRLTAPVVVKTTSGAHGQGVAHSQCLESWLMSVAGLTVVAPATAADAYGLMLSALDHDGPIVFVDHKRLYPTTGEVPLDPTPTPIGKAAVRRHGRHATITAHGYMVRVALEAAARLEEAGIDCEVIDLRTLTPLDLSTIAESVDRTRALVTLEEGQTPCGVGTEVAFRVQRMVGAIRVARVGAMPAPVSSNPVLEAAVVPDAARVLRAVHRMLDA